MPADVFTEEGKHHMGCLTVKANNQPHPQSPRRKSSTNDTSLYFLWHLPLSSPPHMEGTLSCAFMLHLPFSPKFNHYVSANEFITCSKIFFTSLSVVALKKMSLLTERRRKGPRPAEPYRLKPIHPWPQRPDIRAETRGETPTTTISSLNNCTRLFCYLFFPLCKDSDFVVFLIFDLFQHISQHSLWYGFTLKLTD